MGRMSSQPHTSSRRLTNVDISPSRQVSGKHPRDWLGITIWENTRTYTWEWDTWTTQSGCTNLEDEVGGCGEPPCGPGWYFWYTREESSTAHVHHTATTVEIQRWCQMFDPPEELAPWNAIVALPMFRGDVISFETNWLDKLPGAIGFDAALDQQPIKHRQRIDLAGLGRGFHTVDLRVEFKGGGTRVMQGAFKVLDKIGVAFEEPFTKLAISDKSSAHQAEIAFVVSNRTGHTVTVELDDVAAPIGWKAEIREACVFNLGAGRRRTLTLQVELMNDAGFSRSPVAFTVSATTPWNLARPRTKPFVTGESATAYVQVEATENLAERMEDAQKGAKAHRGSIIYGPLGKPEP